MEKKRSTAVTMFGWLLIGYFFYAVIYPLVYLYVEKPLVASSPISSYQIFSYFSGDTTSPGLYVLISYVQLFLPLYSLIAGVAVLQLKGWARVSIVLYYTASLIVLSVCLLFIQMKPELKTYAFRQQHSLLAYYLFLLFQVSVIYFFTRPSVKVEFST